MVSERIELDGEERELFNSSLLKVTFSASKDITIGDDERLGNIVHVSNGEPFGAIETTIENTFGLSSQITLDSKGITNTLASNMGNGIIESSVSVQEDEIKYTYKIILADIELSSGVKTSAAILFNVYLKISDFPSGYEIPVEVTERVSALVNRFLEGTKEVAKQAAPVVGAIAMVGLVFAIAIYGGPAVAEFVSTVLAAFGATLAALVP